MASVSLARGIIHCESKKMSLEKTIVSFLQNGLCGPIFTICLLLILRRGTLPHLWSFAFRCPVTSLYFCKRMTMPFKFRLVLKTVFHIEPSAVGLEQTAEIHFYFLRAIFPVGIWKALVRRSLFPTFFCSRLYFNAFVKPFDSKNNSAILILCIIKILISVFNEHLKSNCLIALTGARNLHVSAGMCTLHNFSRLYMPPLLYAVSPKAMVRKAKEQNTWYSMVTCMSILILALDI